MKLKINQIHILKTLACDLILDKSNAPTSHILKRLACDLILNKPNPPASLVEVSLDSLIELEFYLNYELLMREFFVILDVFGLA